jgi:hypothetical protein
VSAPSRTPAPPRAHDAGRGRGRAARLAAGLALTAALAAALAGAARADPAALPTRLAARGALLLATLDLGAAFGPELEREVGNGLENVVSIWVAVLPEGRREPVLLHGRVIEILYDVWDESYAVTVKDSRNPGGVQLVLPDFAALRRFLSTGQDLVLGPVSALPRGGRFVVEARVELNPISREQLQRTREYIANPASGSRAGGGSRSVFGAVASFLLREPDPGADILVFRSRPYGAGEVPSR